MSSRIDEPRRYLVVDDEPPALAELRFRLEQAEPGAEVETATTAVEALRCLKEDRFDVVFADIQLPGMSGLELVEVVRRFADPPRVVFVSAYDEYAVRAFELRAADYLLKPVSPDRVRETLERLRTYSGGAIDDAGRQLLDKLPVESQARTMLIDTSDVYWAENRDDVVYVHTHDRAYPTRFSLNDLEKRLQRPPFLRIHRSVLANVRKVSEIIPNFNGTYVLKLADASGTELTVSRGRARDLRTLLGL